MEADGPSIDSGQDLRMLGLDVGERRIGVARSDPTGTLATPLPFIRRRSLEKDLSVVVELAASQGANAIVVGIPISLNGKVGPQAKVVMAFRDALALVSPVPVYPQDERFSTAEAERLLRESGHEPSREKGLLDSASAAVILQAYLDSKRRGQGRSFLEEAWGNLCYKRGFPRNPTRGDGVLKWLLASPCCPVPWLLYFSRSDRVSVHIP